MVHAASTAVSVIIPVYNEEKFLPRCLDSVVRQTLDNIEIICVNDGSTDTCGRIINKYAEKDKRFKVISQNNQGLSASRNNGMKIANGEYTFFLDADDYLHPQTLEIFYKIAQKADCPVVISDRFCRLGKDAVNDNQLDCNKVSYKICPRPLADLYKHRFVSAVVWNKLYKTEILRNFRFIEGIYFEDWPFTTCVFSNIARFALIKQRLYRYNTSSPSIVRSQFSVKKIHDYICGIRHVYNYFRERNKEQQWMVVRQKRISCSLKMVLSKITKSQTNKNEIEAYFKQEYRKLVDERIISFGDLSLKSKFRLLRLMWHQRRR